MKIHVCVSPHNVLNSSNTRTNLASQRLLSSLLVLVLTLATIPSTISTPLFTLLDKKNKCDNNDWVDIKGGVSKNVDDVEACKAICSDNIKCVAITFWRRDKYCSVHSRLCDNPGDFATGRQVFRVTRAVTTTTTAPAQQTGTSPRGLTSVCAVTIDKGGKWLGTWCSFCFFPCSRTCLAKFAFL